MSDKVYLIKLAHIRYILKLPLIWRVLIWATVDLIDEQVNFQFTCLTDRLKVIGCNKCLFSASKVNPDNKYMYQFIVEHGCL